MKNVKAFHNGCLRKLCRIFWSEKMSNAHLYKKTKCNSVVLEIKRRSDTFSRWTRTASQRSPYDGLHLGKGSKAAQEHLAAKGDSGAEGDEPNLGHSLDAQHPRQV